MTEQLKKEPQAHLRAPLSEADITDLVENGQLVVLLQAIKLASESDSVTEGQLLPFKERVAAILDPRIAATLTRDRTGNLCNFFEQQIEAQAKGKKTLINFGILEEKSIRVDDVLTTKILVEQNVLTEVLKLAEEGNFSELIVALQNIFELFDDERRAGHGHNLAVFLVDQVYKLVSEGTDFTVIANFVSQIREANFFDEAGLAFFEDRLSTTINTLAIEKFTGTYQAGLSTSSFKLAVYDHFFKTAVTDVQGLRTLLNAEQQDEFDINLVKMISSPQEDYLSRLFLIWQIEETGLVDASVLNELEQNAVAESLDRGNLSVCYHLYDHQQYMQLIERMDEKELFDEEQKAILKEQLVELVPSHIGRLIGKQLQREFAGSQVLIESRFFSSTDKSGLLDDIQQAITRRLSGFSWHKPREFMAVYSQYEGRLFSDNTRRQAIRNEIRAKLVRKFQHMVYPKERDLEQLHSFNELRLAFTENGMATSKIFEFDQTVTRIATAHWFESNVRTQFALYAKLLTTMRDFEFIQGETFATLEEKLQSKIRFELNVLRSEFSVVTAQSNLVVEGVIGQRMLITITALMGNLDALEEEYLRERNYEGIDQLFVKLEEIKSEVGSDLAEYEETLRTEREEREILVYQRLNEADIFEQQLREVKKELAIVRNQLLTKEAELAAVQAEKKELREQLKSGKIVLEEQQTVGRLQVNLERTDAIRAESLVAQTETTGLEAELTEARRAREQLEADLDKVRKQLVQLRSQLGFQLVKRGRDKVSLERIAKTNLYLYLRIVEANKEIKRLRAALATVERVNSELQAALGASLIEQPPSSDEVAATDSDLQTEQLVPDEGQQFILAQLGVTDAEAAKKRIQQLLDLERSLKPRGAARIIADFIAQLIDYDKQGIDRKKVESVISANFQSPISDIDTYVQRAKALIAALQEIDSRLDSSVLLASFNSRLADYLVERMPSTNSEVLKLYTEYRRKKDEVKRLEKKVELHRYEANLSREARGYHNARISRLNQLKSEFTSLMWQIIGKFFVVST